MNETTTSSNLQNKYKYADIGKWETIKTHLKAHKKAYTIAIPFSIFLLPAIPIALSAFVVPLIKRKVEQATIVNTFYNNITSEGKSDEIFNEIEELSKHPFSNAKHYKKVFDNITNPAVMLEIIKKISPDDVELIRDSHQAVATAANTWIINYINTNQKRSNDQEWLNTMATLSKIHEMNYLLIYTNDTSKRHNTMRSVNDSAAIAIAQEAQKLYTNNRHLNIKDILSVFNRSYIDSSPNISQQLSDCIVTILQQASYNQSLDSIDIPFLLMYTQDIITNKPNTTFSDVLQQIIPECTKVVLTQLSQKADCSELYFGSIFYFSKILLYSKTSCHVQFNQYRATLKSICDRLKTQLSTKHPLEEVKECIHNFCTALYIQVDDNDINEESLCYYLDQIGEAIQNMPNDAKKS